MVRNNGDKRKAKRPSVYTPESLMLRVVLGICSLTFGLLVTLAVTGGMEGTVFTALKDVSYGLSGSLAPLMPIVPVWGGLLLIISSRKKAPLRPFVLSMLVLLCLLAVINLFSSVWHTQNRMQYAYLDYIALISGTDTASFNLGSLGVFLRETYQTAVIRRQAGGALGMLFAWPLWSFAGVFPSAVILMAVMVGLILLTARLNPVSFLRKAGQKREQKRALRQAEDQRRQAYEQTLRPAPAYAVPGTGEGAYAAPPARPSPVPPDQTASGKPRSRGKLQMIDVVDMRDTRLPWEASAGKPKKGRSVSHEQAENPSYTETDFPQRAAQPEIKRASYAKPQPAPPLMSGERLDKPKLVLPTGQNRKAKQLEMKLPAPYNAPPAKILRLPAAVKQDSTEENYQRAHRLEETLESFKIPSRVRYITQGPVVTRFELEIAAGINVSRVLSASKNIAMNLEVKSVRIEAPIPGKALVGVEVPNLVIQPVMLREVLESDQMRADTSPLAVALGKDIAGEPIVCNIAEMPHLLIAGTTGAGKSVCISAIINSIIFRASPEQVRMIMVDPKMVELQCYNCLPHLLIPVITDPHKAVGALTWVANEMDARYSKLKERSVKDIGRYNATLAPGMEPMPRIVVIVDELADLMLQCKKEVEEGICRIAQKARAAGIHLVVATQRPSVDVITGLIKANIPSRIAFTVASPFDSRTILDRIGAEMLLGKGDMLYFPIGEASPLRVQGSYITDDELAAVIEYMQRRNRAEFDPDILEQINAEDSSLLNAADTYREGDAGGDAGNGDEFKRLLVQAIEMAVTDRQASVSMYQRRLRIGYARAGRIIDEMEKRGIVSHADGAKPRQVLLTREEFEQMREDV